MSVTVVNECFCGQTLTDDGQTHLETGSRWCYPDEPETLDSAAPV
jgi:hypothetical protein